MFNSSHSYTTFFSYLFLPFYFTHLLLSISYFPRLSINNQSKPQHNPKTTMSSNKITANGNELDISGVDVSFVFECLKSLDGDRQVSSTPSPPDIRSKKLINLRSILPRWLSLWATATTRLWATVYAV